MLIINTRHLEMQEEKIAELKKTKEIWKQRLTYIGLPHQSIISAFSTTYGAWKTVKKPTGAADVS
jgi:hypothetical protein